MKTKAIGAIICMILIATLPIATTTACDISTENQSTGFLGRTTIRGFILFPRITSGGRTINFIAINLHYHTTTLTGTKTGTLRLQRIQIPNNLIGYAGNFYVFASFRGTIDI